MSVWFKYPSDKDITPGHPSGSSIFAPVSGGGGGGYPAYGTVLSTAYGVDYETGAIVYSSILGASVYSQICDVETKADGVGGSYVDWANATNIQYKAVGTFIATSTDDLAGQPVQVPTSTGQMYDSGVYPDRNDEHDGSGGLQVVGAGTFVPYGDGTFIIIYNSTPNTFTVNSPNGYGGNFNNGTAVDDIYVWNGSGGFRSDSQSSGSYYVNGTEVDVALRYTQNYGNLQTEVPAGSSAFYNNGLVNQDTFYWNGSGGTYTNAVPNNPQGSYRPFGEFITDQNCPTIGVNGIGLGYFWDGFNGYYIATYP